MIKRLGKRLRSKKVKGLVPESLSEKASNLNPLSKKDEPPVITEVPRITNETIAVHREEVLKGARKYIYPLQHSKHRIIVVTTILAIVTAVFFLVYCALGLYRFYQHNTFLYRVTQVIPFPVARVDGSFVEYENYLFELRHYTHYYQNQLQLNFSGEDRQQLEEFRKEALQDVINEAYIKKLARQHRVSVSNREVDQRIEQVRSQNRLGDNNKVFADVLRDYWGWSVSDFKRSLKSQILAEKVVAKLDTATHKRAEDALAQLKAGADFSDLAKKVSDDPAAKENGGEYGFSITKSNPNIPPQIAEKLFQLKAGEISGIIPTGETLEIVKVVESDGRTVTAQHITFVLKDISNYVEDYKKKSPPRQYIRFDG